MASRTHPRSLAALVLAAGAAAACDVPEFKGPQIQSPPPAFTINTEAYQERRMFPEEDLIHHDAWVEASWGNFSGIYVNGHRGAFGRERAVEARRQIMAIPVQRPTQVKDFSELEPITIDGREAYGWSEMVRSSDKGLEYVAYRAVVPYDTVTYAIEFVSGEPGFKNRPDSLRTIVASFAIGKVTYNLPLILIAAGAGLFVVGRVRSRASERAARLRGINLVQMPQPEEEESDPAARAPAGGASTSTGSRGADGGGASLAGEGGVPTSLADAIARQRDGGRG